MAISEHVRRIRALVGSELLQLPSVTVLPRDSDGRVLLVRQADTGAWGTIGGTIEPDESPAEAARREAGEEAGISVRLNGIVAVLGGAEFRVVYPNGDEVAYVAVVFDATVESGRPSPDGEETLAVRWFASEDLAGLDLSPFARAQFRALGWLDRE